MKIGLIGGTGDMGRGLALRWALKHHIYVGSRSLEKALTTAEEYNRIARGFYGPKMNGSIIGYLNNDAVSSSDIIVLTIPAESTLDTLRQIKPSFRPDHVVVSTVAPMIKEGRFFKYAPLPGEDESTEASAAERIAKELNLISIVSAFQTVPASYLADLDLIMNMDVFVCGDDEHALKLVSQLIRDIPNLRPLHVGPLSHSHLIESLTSLLMNAKILNRLKDPSIKLVP